MDIIMYMYAIYVIITCSPFHLFHVIFILFFYNMFHLGIEFYLFVSHGGMKRQRVRKFRNARSAFRNLHVDHLSLHTPMRNKQVEFNPYIYTLTTLSKLYRFGHEYPFFNTKHPVIILRASLFVVTPSHVASWKIECQNFSYVHRSRKHWECKYYIVWLPYTYTAQILGRWININMLAFFQIPNLIHINLSQCWNFLNKYSLN